MLHKTCNLCPFGFKIQIRLMKMVVYIIAWSKLNHETHFSPERQVCDEKDLKLKKLSIYNVKVIISCSSISDLLRIKALFF